MRTFYVCPKTTLTQFSQKMMHHYIDLDATYVLVCGEFPADGEEEFLKQPNVEPLPHPLSGKTIANHPHFPLLKTKVGAQVSDSTFDLSERARTFHPLMRF